MSASIRFVLLALCALALLAPHAGAQNSAPPALPPGITLRASADPTNLVVGDTFSYTVTIEGNLVGEQFDFPQWTKLPGLQVVQGPIQRQNMSFSNGRSQVTSSIAFSILAREEGEVLIPPTRVRLNGAWYETEAVQVKVAGVPAENEELGSVLWARTQYPEVNAQLRGRVFARMEVPAKIYAGQVVPLSVYLYRDPSLNFSRFEVVRNAAGNDWVIPDVADVQQGGAQWEDVEFGGKRFQRALLFRVFPVPVKTGTLTLEGPVTRLYFPLQQRNAQSFDDLMMQSMQPNFVAADCEVRAAKTEVLAPPAKPDDALFQVVGEQAIVQFTADRATLPQRELLTLKLSVVGEGFFELVPKPDLPGLAGMDLIDSKATSKQAMRDGALTSMREFEYTYQAREPGNVEIPAVRVAVFDPSTGTQAIKETNALAVSVLASTSNAVLIGGSTNPAGTATTARERADAKTLGTDVDYIDASPLTPESIGARRPFYTERWFWLLQLLPLLGTAGWCAWVVIGRAGGGESEAARHRRAQGAAQQALREARANLGTQDREAFYQVLQRGVLGYVGTLLKRSATGLSSDEAEEAVRRLLKDPAPAEKLGTFLRQCAAIRYSPAPDTPQSREAALRTAEEILMMLQQGERA